MKNTIGEFLGDYAAFIIFGLGLLVLLVFIVADCSGNPEDLVM